MIARDKGLPVKAVAVFARLSDVGLLVPQGAGIKGPQDLKGKKVAYTAGSLEAPFIDAFLAAGGLKKSDIELINVDAAGKAATYAAGRTDAAFSTIPFFLPVVSQTRPSEGIRFADYKLNMPSFGLFAPESKLATRREAISKFASVVGAAWQYVYDGHEDEAVDAIVAQRPQAKLDKKVLRGQIDAIDVVRDLLGVPSVHAIGYCVAGTVLSATLALLAARGEADKVASATFFTAQVDFSEAGDLRLFVDDEQIALIDSLATEGFLDGRYLAATFNLLRGQDLIWNYVVNNYLLGRDYPQFDLLYWNGDTTNLPAKWHHSYLADFYRDNRLAQPGGLTVEGTPIDLRRVETPSYIQAGIEDHIAPACSVWKLMDHFAGPKRFLLAGSGHIAGVVNPPAAGKYQYWTSETPQPDFAAFREGARETRGSWWPDWLRWIEAQAPERIDATGARVPGEGKREAIEDAPGRYARTR